MIGLNVKQYRNEANLTQSELAERIGSAQTVINGIETGTRGFSIEYLEKIADTLKLPVFKFFASEPLVPQSVAEKEPTIIEIFPDQETKIEFEKLRSRDDFIPVRIVGAASLGQGRIVTSEETKGYTLIYRHVLPKGTEKRKRHENPRIIALYVEGDSMTPTIRNKSMVAVDIEDKSEIEDYGIYAVEIPDEGVTIKRVVKDGTNLILMAENKDTRGFPRALNIKTISYNPICGKVIWTWNRLD